MNALTTESEPQLPFTSEDWDRLRFLLQDSVMAKTNLCKLAVNLGTKWPIRGKDETPEKYISHTLESLGELPEFYGKGSRLPLLYSILLETQTLDDPFSDMVQHFDKVAKEENECRLALEELEVPGGLSVEIANFSKETRALCKAENIHSLNTFIDFAQESAKSVLISGDYQRFLNALSQKDIKALKQFLPLRDDRKGLFLAESLGYLAGRLDDREAASLLGAYQIETARPSWQEARILPKEATLDLIARMRTLVLERFDLMPDQAQQLRHAVQSGETACIRYFITLDDPDLEGLALALTMAALDIKPRFKGFIGRYLNK